MMTLSPTNDRFADHEGSFAGPNDLAVLSNELTAHQHHYAEMIHRT
jgi:hypothetical protein